MKEKIETFNKEVNSISEVLEKLLTKQNSSVFDKLCVKCNDLLDRVSQIDSTSISLEDIRGLIGVLKRLLEIANKLKMYKEYLIGVITNNIAELEQQEQRIASTEPEMTQENKSMDNVMRLELKNNEQRDAA